MCSLYKYIFIYICILYVRTFSSRSNITTPFSFETLYYTSSHDDEKEDAAFFFFALKFEGIIDFTTSSPKFFLSQIVV